MEKNFRGLVPAKPFGLHKTSVGFREELRKAKALDLLSRIANVGGTRFGPITMIGAGGIILDDSTPRPFWTRINGREKAFEATLTKKVDADETEFEVSYNEENGVCPHQLPFYAHLVKDESEDKDPTSTSEQGSNAEAAAGGADSSGIGGETGVEGGGSGGGGGAPGVRQPTDPVDIPGQDKQNLPPGTGRKGAPRKKDDTACGNDGNLKPGKKPENKKKPDKFETVLVTKAEDQSTTPIEGGGGSPSGTGAFKWTVKRGQQCTSAQEHEVGDKWEANIPYKWDQVHQELTAGGKKPNEVVLPDRGNWDDYDDGRKSVFRGNLVHPAFEVKGIKVPIDGSAKVLMWLGYDHQTYYLFTFFGGCKDGEEEPFTLPTQKPTYPCSSSRAARVGQAWVVPGKCQLRYYCTDENGKPKVKTALTTGDKDKPGGVTGLNSAGHARFGTTPRSVLGFLRQFGG